MLEINIKGIPELSAALSVAADSFNDFEWLWNALIRPTKGPDGRVLIDRPYTLEGSVQDAFLNEGKNAYRTSKWAPSRDEDNYQGYKSAKNAGTQTGIWEGSATPLFRTFIDKSDNFHVETVSADGFEWGSSIGHAGSFHTGDYYQPWDDMQGTARPIVTVDQKMAFQIGKGAQRYIVQEIENAANGRPGASGNALAALRRFS